MESSNLAKVCLEFLFAPLVSQTTPHIQANLDDLLIPLHLVSWSKRVHTPKFRPSHRDHTGGTI